MPAMEPTAAAPSKRLHPAWIALGAGLVVLILAFLPVLWAMWRMPPVPAGGAVGSGTPWAIERLGGGASRVFGLRLPGATLADARATWGNDLQVALMASRGQAPLLEATVESAVVGGIGGRLLFTADADAATVARWRDAAARRETVSAETQRFTLRPEDRDEALRAPLAGVGFIPAAQLDAAALRARFGPPAQVLPAGAQAEHWLYPELGLAVLLDAKGRELLQYVAPADFERRLRAPLLSPAAPASSPASGPPG